MLDYSADMETSDAISAMKRWIFISAHHPNRNARQRRTQRAILQLLKKRAIKLTRELETINAVIARAEPIVQAEDAAAPKRLAASYTDYIKRRRLAESIVADRSNGKTWAELQRKYGKTRHQLGQSIRWIERCPQRMTRKYYFETY